VNLITGNVAISKQPTVVSRLQGNPVRSVGQKEHSRIRLFGYDGE
jgi:hypothetical protein